MGDILVLTKVTHSILVIGAVFGNLLVCLVVLKHKALRTSINCLIVNLAISDLMIVIAFTPRHILEGLYRHPSGLRGTILCKVLTSDTFTWVGAVASAVTLVIIAYERFTAVTKPLERKTHLTGTKLKIAVVLCWLIAVIFNIPLFYIRKLNRELGICESHWPSVILAKSYNAAWLVLVGILPCCLMIFFYRKVAFHLRKSRREIVHPRHRSVLQSRKRVTKMLMIITTIYGICWIPNLVLYLVWYFVDDEVMYDINEVFLVLMLINSFANPFAYSIGSKTFRKHVKKLLCFCKTGHNVEESTPYFLRSLNSNICIPEIKLVRVITRESTLAENPSLAGY